MSTSYSYGGHDSRANLCYHPYGLVKRSIKEKTRMKMKIRSSPQFTRCLNICDRANVRLDREFHTDSEVRLVRSYTAKSWVANVWQTQNEGTGKDTQADSSKLRGANEPVSPPPGGSQRMTP